MADPIGRPDPNHFSRNQEKQHLKHAFDAGFVSGTHPSDIPKTVDADDGDSATRQSSNSESSDLDGERQCLEDLAVTFRVFSDFMLRIEVALSRKRKRSDEDDDDSSTSERYIRLTVVEALRLFPQPPLLIRRTLSSDLLPGGYNGNKDGYAIPAGTDIFLSVYNLHRSPYFWDKPHEFEPERFLAQKKSEGIEGWAGYDPSRSPGALYPNEIISDFAFLPFGGGPRKCVGDQFALMESTVALTMLLQKFDVELKGSVELVTGATIHTKNGLWCKLKKRSDINIVH